MKRWRQKREMIIVVINSMPTNYMSVTCYIKHLRY